MEGLGRGSGVEEGIMSKWYGVVPGVKLRKFRIAGVPGTLRMDGEGFHWYQDGEGPYGFSCPLHCGWRAFLRTIKDMRNVIREQTERRLKCQSK